MYRALEDITIRHRRPSRFGALALMLALSMVCTLVASAARAQESAAADNDEPTPAEQIRAAYEKHEYEIPVRDGIKLFTAVYSPRDTSGTYPILMRRTPYSVRPYGEDEYRESLGPSKHLSDAGYIFVYQDVRGCYRSEGTFVNMTPHRPNKSSPSDVDESTDTYDTIEWLLANIPNHNGKVGLAGISYPGFYAAAGMIDAHPALVAVSPQAPVSDWWYDDFHHHGAFFLAHSFRFLSTFGKSRPVPTSLSAPRFAMPTQDGYDFYLRMGPLAEANTKYLRDRITFWNQFAAHPNYDEFWQSRNIVPHLKNCAPAVMTVGGWFDAEDLWGPLKIYRSVEQNNPEITNLLVMGPWAHGGWARGDGDRLGNIWFGAKTSDFYRRHIEFPFFERHLKGAEHPALPEAYVFETGTNAWKTFDRWPPTAIESKQLYFHADGALTYDPPETDDSETADQFISDPARPVPFTADIASGMTRNYMTDDQRFAARRPDVLVYQTEPLENPATLAGPLVADLWVATSGGGADWVVKLIDVLPDDFEGEPGHDSAVPLSGYQMMVRSEVIRGRFRNSPENPEPFTPNEPAQIVLELQDVLHTFERGHRIMVQVQSTWFPLVDRNPQKYVDNIYLAGEDDFISATHQVFRSAAHPSHLKIGVLPPEF